MSEAEAQEQKMPESKKPVLTYKQKAFISEYIKDKNGAQAAIRAGYSKRGARVTGSQLLAKPIIKAEIEELLKQASEKALVTAEFVIRGLREVAERCLQAKPVMVFDPVEKCMVQKTEIDPVDGEEKGVWEFDSTGANRALQLLGMNLNLFKDGKGSEDDLRDLPKLLNASRLRAGLIQSVAN